MSVILELIKNEINDDKPPICPTQPLRPGEVVLGTLTDLELRRLYSLMLRLQREVNDTEDQAETIMATSEDGPLKLKTLVRFAFNKAKAISNLFWVAVRAELPAETLSWLMAEGEPGLDLRRDWQIVVKNKPF